MSASSPRTVLIHEWVTGGGMAPRTPPESWAAEGRAMRRAIAADFAAIVDPPVRVTVTLDQRLASDRGPWTHALMAEGDHDARLIDLACQADYTVLIAPETSGVLAGLVRRLEAAGARTLGSSAEAIELTADKLRLGGWLTERGLVTPSCRAVSPVRGLPRDVPYPAVLKPVDGAGSLDTYWIAGPDDLPATARRMPLAVLQPFITGQPMSASFLVHADHGATLVGVGRMCIETKEGRFDYRGGVLPVCCPEAIPVLRAALGTVPGLRGFVGVDFIWDAPRGEATVLEINPRATTSYVGLSKLLPAGTLATGWLAACGMAPGRTARSADLADRVQRCRPITFDAAGNVRDGNLEEECG